MMDRQPLFHIENLSRHYRNGKKILKAVDNVSFDIFEGETLGLVGESGCGKTTCGRTLIGLYGRTSGTVLYQGVETAGRKSLRKEVQMVFQDASAALDPRMTVEALVAEGIDVHHLARNRRERREQVLRYLELVGLGEEHLGRYAHEFSGGQRQRIGIARALAVEPRFILLDEPISALDVSIQAQIVNLLMALQKKLGLTYLFVAHDLSMVRIISDRVAVMYRGNLVELASSDEIYYNPLHPYTKTLYAAASIPDPQLERRRLAAQITPPDLPAWPEEARGCKFTNRCPYRSGECGECFEKPPVLTDRGGGHFVACHTEISNIGAAPADRQIAF